MTSSQPLNWTAVL